MGLPQFTFENVEVRLARNSAEVEAAQHLRYKVFYEEYSARASDEMVKEKRDIDAFDSVADHLIVLDNSKNNLREKIVGTYRLLRQSIAEKQGKFYTSDEYNIDPLLQSKMPLLELGRSCVLAEYRTRPILNLLWEGITEYLLDHNIELMFGCASFQGTDIEQLSKPLAYMYHNHLAPAQLLPRALDARYIDMNLHPAEEVNNKAVFNALPPLIKGYLRIGAYIGDGAVIDEQFNTTDVCIVLPTDKVAPRYRKHYSRKVNRDIPHKEECSKSDQTQPQAQAQQ